MDILRITVVSPEKGQLDTIEKILRKVLPRSRMTAIEGSLQRLGTTAAHCDSDILIVDCGSEDGAALAPVEQLSALHPHTAIIILSACQTPDFLLQAMRLGVREVLPSPVESLPLEAALARIRNKAALATARAGRVLAFVSCKGGSGSSFLATNLAYTLSAQGNAKVALFDFDLQSGDALLYLSEDSPAHTLTDVVRGIHRLDSAFLKASMTPVGANLAVLPAPADLSDAMEVKADHIDALIATARREHDYVILDVGRTLDARTMRALDQADTIYAVFQPTLPFVRGARRMLEVFRTLEYPEHKVELIMNRLDKSADLGEKEIAATLGRPIGRVVPNNYEAAAASANQGVPVARLARASPIARTLEAWSTQLANKPAQEGKSWVSRVLKGDFLSRKPALGST